ncbi:MAG: hypothetical protein GY796_15850 [Chloroflexi bacterium]|nr:hypothetical protein [Chloroflexota bacterium]
MFAGKKKTRRTYPLFLGSLLLLLLLLFSGGRSVQAHAIVVDGALGDWCGVGAGPPDSYTLVTGCGGTEHAWTDTFFGDTDFGVVDIADFLVTGDPATLYFGLAYSGLVGISEHFQIAIDVPGPMGPPITWYDPAGVGLGLVGATAGITPDYLIVACGQGCGAAPTLYESVSFPGTWTATGAMIAGADVTAVSMELSLPWGAFGPAACAGCPPLGPGGSAFMSVMGTIDGSTPLCVGTFTPGVPECLEDDIISEAAAGMFTTTPTSCPPGTPPSVCELVDGSSDGFLIGTMGTGLAFAAPTAVNLTEITTPNTPLTPLPLVVAVGLTLLGSGALIWRRRTRPS